MSRQLAISAAFAVFSMAAFALTATPDASYRGASMQTGATTEVAAPAFDRLAPDLFDLIG